MSNIFYLFTGYKPLECDGTRSKVSVIKDKGGLSLVVFSIANQLIFIQNHDSTENTVSHDMNHEQMRQFFARKRNNKMPCKYYYISFNDNISDFCFHVGMDGLFVLTNDACWAIQLKTLFLRVCPLEENMESDKHDDVFMDLLKPYQRFSKQDSLATDISNIKTYLLKKDGARKICCFNSTLCILSHCTDHITMHLADIESTADIKVRIGSEKSFKLLNKTSNASEIGLSILSQMEQTSCDISLSAGLFTQLFGANNTLLNSVVAVFSTNDGDVFYIPIVSSSVTEKASMICSLKQPLHCLLCLSIKIIKYDETFSMFYEQAAKANIEAHVQTFKEKIVAKNCLVFVGQLGKVFLNFYEHDGQKQPTLSFYQLASPVISCIGRDDLLIISDLKKLYVYKLIIKINSIQEISLSKQIKDVVFTPELSLVYTAPLVAIETMCFDCENSSRIVCVNASKKVLKFNFKDNVENSEPANKNNDLESAIKTLESVNTEVESLKTKSAEMNNSLFKLKLASSICYRFKRQHGAFKYKSDPYDIVVQLQKVMCNSENKLLAMCTFLNNTEITFLEGWSVTIKYYHAQYKTIASDGTSSTACAMENIIFPCIAPNQKFKFNFLVDFKWLKYSSINVDFYLNFSLAEYNINESYKGASFYLKSYVIDIIDMCSVFELSPVSFLLERGKKDKISKSESLIKELTICNGVRSNLQEGKFKFRANITPKHLKFMQDKNQQKQKVLRNRDDVAHLCFSFILKSDVEYKKTSFNLVHMNGEEVELALSTVDVEENYVLEMSSMNLSLLVAIRLYVQEKWKDCGEVELKSKDDCEANIERLQNILHRCETLHDDLDRTDMNELRKDEIRVKVIEMYLELRN